MKKVRVILVALISICLVVGLYYYLSNRAGKKTVENNKDMTEVESVISRNLDTSYPETPRAVIKFYNRIVCCLYNDEYTDKQLNQLAAQERKLMDEELKESNPEDTYLASLKKEVKSYKDAERQIANTNVSDSADVVMKKVKGEECAYVDSSYFVKEANKTFTRSVQEFVLRKDKDDNWKIIGFYMKEGDKSDD